MSKPEDVPQQWREGVISGQARVRIVARPYGFETVIDCSVPSKAVATLEEAERRAELAVKFMAPPETPLPVLPAPTGTCPECGRWIGLRPRGVLAHHLVVTPGEANAPRCPGSGELPRGEPASEEAERAAREEDPECGECAHVLSEHDEKGGCFCDCPGFEPAELRKSRSGAV